MKTFEYHTVSANPAPCDWMEEFGIEGWELVAIVYRENSGGVFYFKREINNPSNDPQIRTGDKPERSALIAFVEEKLETLRLERNKSKVENHDYYYSGAMASLRDVLKHISNNPTPEQPRKAR